MSQSKMYQFRLPLAAPKPKQVYAQKNAGICSVCGFFSLDLRAETRKVRKSTRDGKRLVRAPRRLLCKNCRSPEFRIETHGPSHTISPTAVCQMLFGCPLQYYLEKRNPEQPASREHALGVAFHGARRVLFETTLADEESFLFRNPWASARTLCRAFWNDVGFPHGIYGEEWERELLADILWRMLVRLWKGGQIISKKQLAERDAKLGVTLLWAAAEHVIRPVWLDWLLEDVVAVPPELAEWGFRGAADLILVRMEAGRATVKIVDFKIPGVDYFPEANGREVQMQLSLYGLWVAKAFRGLGVEPEDIVLEAQIFDPASLSWAKTRVPFDRARLISTAEALIKAIDTLMLYRRVEFPERPRKSVCQACDFGFECQPSAAWRGRWGIGVSHEPIQYPAVRAPKRQREPKLF